MPARVHRRVWTEEIDTALSQVYVTRDLGGLGRLSQRLNIPKSTLARRAFMLKLPKLKRFRFRVNLWTDTEDQLLIEHGHLATPTLQRRMASAGFKRGLQAIRNRRAELKRAGHPVGLYREEFTLQEVAEGMGCDDLTILKWIRCLDLKATALSPTSERAKHYRITEYHLRKWCLANANAVARCNPDIVWYTGLIAGDFR